MKNPIKSNAVIIFMLCISILAKNTSAQNKDSLNLQILILNSIKKSHQIKIQESNIEKVKLDKRKAYETYLPKITGEVTYTYLNDDIRLPSDMENLLTSTQMLLIKEAAAIKTVGMPIPASYKVTFSTPYNSATDPASITYTKLVQENLKEIPPLQKQNIFKANVSVQWILFSGLKVPLSIKAVNHQIKSMEYISEKEKTSVIKEVIKFYDQMAVLNKSEDVLNKTEKYLNEQIKFVENAIKNGLATDLDRQKIMLAKQQLQMKRIELNTSKKLVISKLSQLSGIQIDSLMNIQPKLSDWMITDFSGDVTQRSDYKAIDEAVAAAGLKRHADYTDYVPKIFAFGKKEFYTADLSTFDPKWYVGVGLKWNIFDGFTAHRNAQQTKVDQIVLKEKRDEAKELLNLNMQKAQFEVEKSIQLYAVAEQQVKTAQEAFNMVKKQYETGLSKMTDFLESLNILETANLELIKAKYQIRQAVVEFLDASGKLTLEHIKE